MKPTSIWRGLITRLRREHRGVKSFAQATREAGDLSSVDRGIATVPTEKIIGSVSRAQNLRSDFFYRTGRAMTQRFYRIGAAMAAGTPLPVLELYRLKRRANGPNPSPPTEYYVVDGHHRVAMARKLGQDFLDAHVVEFNVESSPPPVPPTHDD